ncbi:unnamed protein product (macronuclear) [Paramecium tetraurelia]|uniref:Acylphosphatase-like domain-containing protein n=1 Tax=Paramecium tetraurelia TaxID=5888 RepID=A0CLF7_PARTE|nr:uncharacterized protein GSPATT00008172001 [Paramecium tetraurelia]CAK71624.1 unnamed protein product [Paramecium tetraurelia]|eukprot:XP_001439021.1 hypothetical protein (macronuclear) [Paramecium tetraurelia strain d4-2]
MKLRSISTIDHPKEFLFPIEPDLSASKKITNTNIYQIYQKNKQATPNRHPLQSQFNFTNTFRLENNTQASPLRLYPEKTELINLQSKRSLTPSSKPQQIKVKGLSEKFNEIQLKRTLRHQGVGIVYCRQNYNKINNKGDGTGEIMLEDIQNLNYVKQRLKTFGLELENEAIHHEVKHMISEKFARILQTEKNKTSRNQYNYFRA